MLEHLIFTPFCFTKWDDWKAGIGQRRPDNVDCLAPAYVESRMRYLEAVCFASIAGQSNQNFTWILATDPELPDRFVAHLERGPERVADR